MIFHALVLVILTPLFLPSSSVSLSYFIIAVPFTSVLENTLARVPHFLYYKKVHEWCGALQGLQRTLNVCLSLQRTRNGVQVHAVRDNRRMCRAS